MFTTLDGKEETGPTSTSGYAGTSLDGKVTLSNGIQIWSVPVTGRYIIEAFGASGANGTDSIQFEWRIGGLGAKMEGTFALAKGAKLKILIGQEGRRTADLGDKPGGGGGGTFVTLLDDTPLIIAGGGGGGGTSKSNMKTVTPVRRQRMAPGVVGREGMVANLAMLIQGMWTLVSYQEGGLGSKATGEGEREGEVCLRPVR